MRKSNEKGKMFVIYKRPADVPQTEEEYYKNAVEKNKATLLRAAHELHKEMPEWSAKVIAEYGHLKVVTGKAERKCV